MKFLALYRSSVSARQQMSSMTPAQGKEGMALWMTWFEKHKTSIVDMGAPLGDSIMLKGTPGVAHFGGYSIVQADSLDAARQIFEGHPHFHAPDSSIEIIEVLPTPGT